MTTNFEKWKAGLTPLHMIDKGCEKCPLYFCDEWYKEFSDVADMVGLGSCENLFNEWANKEADAGG